VIGGVEEEKIGLAGSEAAEGHGTPGEIFIKLSKSMFPDPRVGGGEQL
jgi:hypothetical protein